MKKLNQTLIALSAILLMSCITEVIDPETGEKINCPAVSLAGSVAVKITSESPLPENFALEINNSGKYISTNCGDSLQSKINLSDSRKEAYAFLSLLDLEEGIQFDNQGKPIDDYIDFSLYSYADCGSEKVFIQERPSILINWVKNSHFHPKCENYSYTGSVEFKVLP